MKRGRPSKEEIITIQTSNLDVEELAKQLDRTVDFVNKFKQEVEKLPEDISEKIPTPTKDPIGKYIHGKGTVTSTSAASDVEVPVLSQKQAHPDEVTSFV